MYFNLLPKQQLRTVARLIQKRQLVVAAGANRPATIEASALETANLERSYTLLDTEKRLLTLGQKNYTTARLDKESATEERIITNKDEPETFEELDMEAPNFLLKTVYAEETDEIMKSLNRCENAQELQNILASYGNQLTLQNRVQTIILLWAFCCQQRNALMHQPKLLDDAVAGLRPHILAMNINELSCCYLYLRRMGIPNTNAVTQELLLQALHMVETSELVPLPALSRLVVAINTGRDFHTPTVCQHFMPHILSHISACRTELDVRLLSICLLNLQPLVGLQALDDFKTRVRELLTEQIINTQTLPKIILKALHLLNQPQWSQHNAPLIRELLLLLQKQVPQLSDSEIRNVCRIFQYHLEPACLVDSLMKATDLLLQRQPTPDTLACFMPFAEPTRREPLVTLFKRLLHSKDSWPQPNASGNLFAILRSLKISDVRVCDAYWANVLNELDACEEEETQLRFLRHCHRYMNFNNNLGGTYRFLPLERKLSQMAMSAIENDLAGRIPVKFARLASFVLAYGQTPFCWKKFPNVIISKIITMSNQFSAMDCFLISRGIQIAMEIRFRYHVPSVMSMQLATIDSILSACAERHLQPTDALKINDLNLIVRTLGNRKSLKSKIIYHEALNKYKDIDCNELNSRTIREMAFNFNASNFTAPKTLEAMFAYIESNHEHIMGDTVEKVLTCAYNLGYTPASEDVLNYAAAILMRDFKHMSGLSLVQACLALCYYKTIPEDLINRVFCVKFIKRIEEEIQTCYSKATYPERVLNLVMQLNRTVCLDFPEANVPWFQQNYLEAQLSKKPQLETRFSHDVKKLLEAVLKDETYFRCNHTTPYGYQIDFVIHFDRDKKPMPAPVETTMLDRITKVAILLLRLDSYCENDLTALRGPEYLKMKHLEMMGYKVLHINEHDWNSKYMNVPQAKANYLKCLLQIAD